MSCDGAASAECFFFPGFILQVQLYILFCATPQYLLVSGSFHRTLFLHLNTYQFAAKAYFPYIKTINAFNGNVFPFSKYCRLLLRKNSLRLPLLKLTSIILQLLSGR